MSLIPSSLANKIEKLSISTNAKELLRACVDGEKTIIDNYYCEGLVKSLHKELKSHVDLISFLLSLVDDPQDRFIKLPQYVRSKPRKEKGEEIVLDEYGNYGVIVNVVSNRKSFNFSIRLNDLSVVKYNLDTKQQERGCYRSFTLTDKYGNISNNWKVLKVFHKWEHRQMFDNHKKSEQKKFSDFIDDTVSCLLLDIRYFLLKCYINRLTQERDYWAQLRETAIERMEHFDLEYEIRKIQQELEEQVS